MAATPLSAAWPGMLPRNPIKTSDSAYKNLFSRVSIKLQSIKYSWGKVKI
jgi:hypothetical protein